MVCSLADSKKWRFSTIYAPRSAGHPVSGNREFGIMDVQNSDESFIFYTKGADRPADFFSDALDFITFFKRKVFGVA